MKEPAVCQLAEVMVRTTTKGFPIVAGQTVDLALEIAPGFTLREALGKHVAGFAPVVKDSPKTARRTAPAVAEE
jgi:hypothetical protein